MKRKNFLVTYDIANPKRLRKVAKLMEKEATRIQKSVFFYPDVLKVELKILVEKLTKLIDEKEDEIRIYTVNVNKSIHLKSGIDLKFSKLILGEVYECI